MSEIELIAQISDAGKRLDSFLAETIEGMTRSAAQNLLSEGAVMTQGAALKKNYRLTGAEVITVRLPELREVDLIPENIPLDIIYEDHDIVVVNKSRGMVVHPAAGNWDGTLVNALMYHCGSSLSGINGEHRPGIVHRIDKDTSGLLVVAKNDAAHQSLAAQIASHSAFRGYEAIVVGSPRLDEEAQLTNRSHAIKRTAKKWPLSKTDVRQSRTIPCSNGIVDIRTWRFGWKLDEPIKFVCIWHLLVIRL